MYRFFINMYIIYCYFNGIYFILFIIIIVLLNVWICKCETIVATKRMELQIGGRKILAKLLDGKNHSNGFNCRLFKNTKYLKRLNACKNQSHKRKLVKKFTILSYR